MRADDRADKACGETPWSGKYNGAIVHPRITLITPSLNQGNFIAETIESVAAQRYPNLEYFVIDGGSSDQTAEVVRRYPSVVADFVSEADRGQAEALNKGFARATGDIYCWLNADDLLEPGALMTIGDLYQRSGFSFVYGDGWKRWEGRNFRRRIRTGVIDPARLKVRDTILQPSAFWSREVAGRIGKLDETLQYVFDWDFFVRVSLAFPMRYIPVPLSTYRIHPQHKSATGGKARAAEIVEVIRRYAPPEWRSAFEDLWLRYDRMHGNTKILRLWRAALLALREPALLARHGPKRLGLSALTLL